MSFHTHVYKFQQSWENKKELENCVSSVDKAARENNIGEVKRPIDAIDDVHRTDEIGQSPLHIVSQQVTPTLPYHSLRRELLLTKPAKEAARHCTGRAIRVLRLIERNANVNKANNEGLTPLHQALFKSHLEVVLIGKGADASSAKYYWCHASLHEACRKGFLSLAQ
jgi:ankyrin repeat protein